MILTNGFPPDPRVYKEAKTLAKNGYDVEILCWDRENSYLERETEKVDGFTIKRFFPFSRYGSGIKQIFPYISFIRQIKKYLSSKEIDIVHAHDIDALFAATLIKGQHKLVWDMHEFFDGSKSTVAKLFSKLAPYCFKRTNGIIIVSEKQRERYANMIRTNTKVALVMNAAESKIFENIEHTDSDRLRISFIGNVRDYESLTLMINIVDKLDGVDFYIHGDGHILDAVRDYSSGKKNVIITGRYAYEDAAELYANTDLVYSLYTERVNVVGGIFNKFFESIVAKVPILGNKDTYNGSLIEKLDTGYVVKAGDEQGIRALIDRLIKNPAELNEKVENIKLIKNDYSWENQGKEMLELYDELLKEKTR